MKKLTAWVCILMSLLGLAACGGPAESEEAAVGGDLLPQIMVEGVLYGDTGTESLLTDRRSGFDGEITSRVDQSQLPTENDQSNFGTGYGYQFGEKPGTVELCVDGRWWVYATAEAREQILHPEQTDPGRWGLSLETEAVTDSGLTILCRHSGGEDVAELHTGSYYVIQKSVEAGWVDVEYLTGCDLHADDIDMLIPRRFLNKEWSAFQAMLEDHGYVLTDLHEHTFEKDGISFAYAQLEELEDFADIAILELLSCRQAEAVFLLLTLEQYLKVYAASAEDGYRVNVKHKQDGEKIRLIEALLKNEE